MNYRLIALDMDGTVLNSKKVISPRNDAAIRQAMSAGKEVIFATGRCPSEMKEYFETYPEMHYAMCLSGGLILHIPTGNTLASITLTREQAESVLAVGEQVGAMTAVYAGEDVYVDRRWQRHMGEYGCQCFADLYDRCARWVDDVRQGLEEDRIYKVNLYCPNEECWEKAARLLEPLGLSRMSGIPNDHEVSPAGVDKGKGLELLCAVAGIPIAQAIAVGDEGNDLAMIRAAGLGVAMGNAIDAVMEAADAMTADCDHDGVAEVINACLL